jgi:hypothetical protein
MSNQMNQSVGAGGDDSPSDANSADRLTPPKHIVSSTHVVGKDLQLKLPQRAAAQPVPKVTRAADVRALEAHIERRGKLAAKIRLEEPSRTEEEIEERLEQFGA